MWVIIILLPILFVGSVFLASRIPYRIAAKKYQEFDAAMMKKLPEIEYTEIVESSSDAKSLVEINPKMEGDKKYYLPGPTTKFLIVYKSNQKQMVSLRDGTPFFNECVKLLKK